MTEIIKVTAEDSKHLNQVKLLFREYANWLNVDLSFQQFEDELANLPGVYVPPTGALFLALVDGQLAGCVAIRSFDDSTATAEMKRLFVKDAFKGHGVGKALASAAIAESRELGYKRILLDTLAHMRPAIDLYTSLGFQPIAAYYDNPISDAVYLSLNIEEDSLT
ncbi:Ribosomal protein S18 acetylase RimI [Chitinophaga ginsengisegetis]|jgi:ribosomal protein S18 acetylase RimI-like enzyme|uniref:Ribosomal protein S18 acetylase RimI n=1 Tax=Chitinophaga ginsengisegetis TaxID=393003 RepID=A0A1T5PAF0_9BACT|nr:GNAT family N-acetyltransferase [Chitinophaga ginsengisegetis]MDR6569921.1 carbonic anhydrase [Chitinophaga ginsengisegetis]MDR6649654.1 carbonic anhydrase [Chitinophaga ginsengisegetis]MDR6656143.1 carbonic anhydrase [Chitinophaga ginsengisegetis]SKD09710.1 Ribosomal protein S18 acetylase RimI [Chitinophaga ginsengisegetis]